MSLFPIWQGAGRASTDRAAGVLPVCGLALCLVLAGPQDLVGGTGLSGCTAAHPQSPAAESEETLINSSQTGDLWLQCRVGNAGSPSDALSGFCDRLAEAVAQSSGRMVRRGDGAPPGATMVEVTVDTINAHRAGVILAVGVQSQGGFQETARQEMNLSVADAYLSATSATGLVYPLLKLLDQPDQAR